MFSQLCPAPVVSSTAAVSRARIPPPSGPPSTVTGRRRVLPSNLFLGQSHNGVPDLPLPGHVYLAPLERLEAV
jgi:hypothetical protein